ncbi:MAG: hypothetical protein LBU53_10365, partial [Zoogloeaceae bacterium]|nr:hypothetical protein [Zoogloeaceae bacterium]
MNLLHKTRSLLLTFALLLVASESFAFVQSGYTDAEGRQTQQQRDLLGQLLRQEDPAALIERAYAYRKAGEVERVDDKHRGQIRLSYDKDGRLLERYR